MDLPSEVAVMTLPNAILFPNAVLPLYIFEPRYRRMLADSLATHRMFSVAMQRPGRVRETPSLVAGLGLIRAARQNEDGTSMLLLQGITRVELAGAVRYKPYRVHRIQALPSAAADNVVVDALLLKLRELVVERLRQAGPIEPQLVQHLVQLNQPDQTKTPVTHSLEEALNQLIELHPPDQLADLVSRTLLPSSAQRQTILETVGVAERLKHLIHFLMAEIRRNRKDDAHE
jgi:ATP-dependent Lon protease